MYRRRRRYPTRYRRRRTFRPSYRFGSKRFSRYRRYRRRSKAQWYSRKYNFRECFPSTTLTCPIVTGSTGTLSGAFVLSANDLPLWTTRSTLGDQYKIYKWKITITPNRVTPLEATSGTDPSNIGFDSGLCFHYLVPDYTDNTAPSAVLEMMENPLCVKRSTMRPISMIIRPRVKSPVYESHTTVYGFSPKIQWISSVDADVKHYGFKYFCDCSKWQNTTGTTLNLDFNVDYTVYYGIKNCQATN